MSDHKSVRTPGGTTLYLGAKPSAVRDDTPGGVPELLGDVAACVDACLEGKSFEPVRVTGRGLTAGTLDDVLGEGEVKLWVREPGFVSEAIESVMPGIWRLTRRTEAGDIEDEWIDVGAFPRLVDVVMERHTSGTLEVEAMPPGAMSAGPVLNEIRHHMTQEDPHTIVLTNLPMSPNDMEILSGVLGEGPVAGGSKGYSTTRVRSTNFRRVWRVNYLNSDGQVIYDAIELTPAPLSLAAPREDIEDGRERLGDLMRIYC